MILLWDSSPIRSGLICKWKVISRGQILSVNRHVSVPWIGSAGSSLGCDGPLASSKSHSQDWKSLAPLCIIVEMN